MTDKKMTPDEFAQYVVQHATAHGFALTSLAFNSGEKYVAGSHSYRGVFVGGLGDAPKTILRPENE